MSGKTWMAGVGIALVTSGCNSAGVMDSRDPELSHNAPPVAAFDYACDNGTVLHVKWWKEKATVSFNGKDWILPRALSGSGARFSDGVREVWEHQGEVRVTGPEGEPVLCRKADANGS